MSKSTYNTAMDFRLSASLGLITGVRTANIFGFRENVNSVGGQSDLVNFGGDDYIFPSDAGEEIRILSDNAADTDLTYMIDGLDANGIRQELIATTDGSDGTTPVIVLDVQGNPAKFSRTNFQFNISPIPSLGNVTLQNAAVTIIYSRASILAQQSNSGIYTNPLNEDMSIIGLIPTIRKTAGGDTGGEVGVMFRLKNGVFRGPAGFGLQRSGNTTIALENLVPDTIPGFSDIKLQSGADAVNTTMAARLAIILTKNAQ